MVNEFPQAQMPGEGGRQEQTGIGHQAVIVKDDTDTVGVVASIYWVLLFWDCFAVTKPLSQIQRSTLWPLQALTTPSFGGFGFMRVWTVRSGTPVRAEWDVTGFKEAYQATISATGMAGSDLEARERRTRRVWGRPEKSLGANAWIRS